MCSDAESGRKRRQLRAVGEGRNREGFCRGWLLLAVGVGDRRVVRIAVPAEEASEGREDGDHGHQRGV